MKINMRMCKKSLKAPVANFMDTTAKALGVMAKEIALNALSDDSSQQERASADKAECRRKPAKKPQVRKK
jgi:hypothetical protein